MSDTKELVARACAAAGNITTVELATLLGVDRSNLYRATLSKPLRNAVLQVINGASAPAKSNSNGNGAEPAVYETETGVLNSSTTTNVSLVVEPIVDQPSLEKRLAAFYRAVQEPSKETRESVLWFLSQAAAFAAETELATPSTTIATSVFNAVEVNMFRRRRVAWQEQLAWVVGAATFTVPFAIAKKNNLRFAGSEPQLRLALFVFRRLVVFAENQSMKDRTKFWGEQFKLNGHRRGLAGFRPEWLETFNGDCAEAATMAHNAVCNTSEAGFEMARAALDQRSELLQVVTEKVDGIKIEVE